MDKGSIIEQGSHDQLVKTKTNYKQMFERQAGWYTNPNSELLPDNELKNKRGELREL